MTTHIESHNRISRMISALIIILLSNTALAQEPWQDNHMLQQHRLPARAYFLPYQQQPGDSHITLNGDWHFRWTPTPEGRIADFFRPDFDDSSWALLAVPANWEVNGYGTPVYASAGYTFRIDPPYVMSQPKDSYTSYKERNPTGQYRRTFQLPSGWTSAGRNVLRFEGVMSAFHVWVNGKHAGYSQGSCEASEFDVTPLLHEGQNQVAVEVYKYSDGAYLEDQDFWRFGGIHRDITLYHTQSLRLRDFTVRTIAADESFTSFHLQINPKLEVSREMLTALYEGRQTPELQMLNGAEVRAILQDSEGHLVAQMSTPAEPILDLNHKAATMNEWYPQRGHMKFERMDTLLNGINAWTAETPYLYKLTLQVVDGSGNIVEQATEKVGFRQLSIDHGRLLVNGKQVRLRGVNRHEHDAFTAHVMTEATMLRDLRLMKDANINAIRLGHYPNTPRFYELCDSMGFYIMDEANCENHGVRGTFTSTPDWNDAMMDRVIRMAERDKNHPSVVFWSLGNESGYGANHASMAGWLHEFDPTRFVHYEGAQGYYGAGTIEAAAGEELLPDPQCVDVISRFYPRVQQEYLNPGIPEGSDQERAENARWEFLKSIAERKAVFKDGIAVGKADDRPVMTSEYAHCMGNALGNFSEYWEEFYSNPRMLGGFIWDWVDQGIIVPSPENGVRDGGKAHTTGQRVLYGGDFGDKPNLKAFCLNGVIFADRTTDSKYQEVKTVYSPVQIRQHGDDIYVVNRSSHLPLSAYKATWTLLHDGIAVKAKKGKNIINLPDIAYGDSTVIASMSAFEHKNGADTRLNISITELSTDREILITQVPSEAPEAPFPALTKPKKGNAESLSKLLKTTSVDTKNPYSASFFRAPTDNDTGFGNWLAKDWTKQRLDSATVIVVEDAMTEGIGRSVVDYIFNNGVVENGGKIRVTTTTTALADGWIDLVQTYECEGTLPELPRMALQLVLPEKMQKLEYYGRGPWDNYPDRKASALVGRYQSTVAEQFVHYPKPQDCGNHEDCSFVNLQSPDGHALTIVAVDAPFAFSALPLTPQEIASVRHDFELPQSHHTVLTLSAATLGLGNGSCGPGVLRKYAIDKSKKHVLHILVHSS